MLTRVIEYYFEKGDVEQAKRFCNMAIDVDVEPSFEIQELRDLYATVKANRARIEAGFAALEKRQEERKVATKKLEAEHQAAESERETRQRLDKFLAVLKESDVTVVKSVTVRQPSDGMWEAKIEVRNLWHLKAYQIRLQDAQTLWKVWSKIASPQKLDSARISIVDLNDNEVGGSRVLAGSLIWVQEN